jgi:hypothetical protein
LSVQRKDGASSCLACAAGSIAPTKSSTTCTSCSAGTTTLRYGGNLCLTFFPIFGAKLPVYCEYISVVPLLLTSNMHHSPDPHITQSNTTTPTNASSTNSSVPGHNKTSFHDRGESAEVEWTRSENMNAHSGIAEVDGVSIAGATRCVPCAAGKFANFAGASSCQDCKPNFISEHSASTTCLQCPRGTYQVGTWSQAGCGMLFYTCLSSRTVLTLFPPSPPPTNTTTTSTSFSSHLSHFLHLPYLPRFSTSHLYLSVFS